MNFFPPGHIPAMQAAGRLNVSRQRIGQYIDDGRLSAIHIGRSLWVKASDVQRLQRNRPKMGRPKNSFKKTLDSR